MEVKELIEYLNIEGVTEESTLKELKEKFNTRFSLTEEIDKEKKNLGKRLGSATTDIKKLFKENGVEFEDGEMEGGSEGGVERRLHAKRNSEKGGNDAEGGGNDVARG